MANARDRRLSLHQFAMLKRAATWDGGMVPIIWRTMRTAKALERREFGNVRQRFDWKGWGMIGWCFVINEHGRKLVDRIGENHGGA